jgi:hypothetical protein
MIKRNIKNHDNNLNPEEVLDKCPCARWTMKSYKV